MQSLCLALLVLAADAQPTSAAPTKRWYQLTNYPGYWGYGALNANGWVIMEHVRPMRSRPVGTNTVLAPTSAYDPTGMVNVLNSIRARYGLNPVAYDANAAHAARINNGLQAARGIGHHYTAGYAQNAAMGSDIWGMWMNSPGHRALILSPSLTSAGGSTDGAWSSLNASGHYGGLGMMRQSRGVQEYPAGAVTGRPQFRMFNRWRRR